MRTRDGRATRASAIAAVCAGPVPQHPPTIAVPSSTAATACSATYRGVAGYTNLPAETRRPARVRPPRDGHVARHRHDHADQPQHLRRSLAAVHADHVGTQLDEASSDLLGGGPERGAIVTRERGAREHRDAGRAVASGRERELHLAEVGLRLDHQEVHARLGERRRLLQVCGRARRRHAPARRGPAGRPADPSTLPPPSRRTISRDGHPRSLIASTRSAMPCWASRKRFAPNVFVITRPAPASTNARCRTATRSGSSTFQASTHDEGAGPLASSDVPVPPSASSGPSASSARSASGPMPPIVADGAVDRLARGSSTVRHRPGYHPRMPTRTLAAATLTAMALTACTTSALDPPAGTPPALSAGAAVELATDRGARDRATGVEADGSNWNVTLSWREPDGFRVDHYRVVARRRDHRRRRLGHQLPR